MLKILGRTTSSNVQKVLWLCGELDIPFEREDVGGPFGGNDTPEYLALNPNGRVPTMIEDDFVLWESNTIIRYLAAKHGAGTLYPDDLRTRARGEKWMDWQLSVMSSALVPVFWGMIRTPPEDRDEEAIAKAVEVLADKFAILDGALAESAYLAGEEFTVADIPLGISAYRWFAMEIPRRDFPNLSRWYESLCVRPPFKEHIMQPLA